MSTDQHDILQVIYLWTLQEIQNYQEVDANKTASLSRDIKDEVNFMLTKEVTHWEIHQTVNQLNPLNAPSPNSIYAIFYQNNWWIICKNIIWIVKSFIQHAHLLKDINKTSLVLIPKKDNSENISHVRPISLGNVTYKLWKILANTFRLVLPKIISPLQDTFLQSKDILWKYSNSLQSSMRLS